MTQAELVAYLKQGRERGFELSLLKKNLLEAGFSSHDVEDAIRSLPARPSVSKQESFHESSNTEECSFFKKFVYATTHPHTLVERTRNESFLSTFLFNELISVAPFMILSLGLMLAGRLLPAQIPVQFVSLLSSGAEGSLIFLLLGLAGFSFIVLPTFVLGSALSMHLMVKIVRGQGLYRETYKSVVYGTTLAFILIPILLVLSLIPPAGMLIAGSLIGVTLISSFILTTRALASYHDLSLMKSFIATFLGAFVFFALLAGIIVGIALLSSQPPQFDLA